MKCLWIACCALLLACGGQVRDERTDDRNPGSGSGGDGKGDGKGDSNGFYSEPLPDCEPGPPAPQADCPWVARGRCYPDKQSACACECEQTKGTLCISGFPGQAVEVSCP